VSCRNSKDCYKIIYSVNSSSTIFHNPANMIGPSASRKRRPQASDVANGNTGPTYARISRDCHPERSEEAKPTNAVEGPEFPSLPHSMNWHMCATAYYLVNSFVADAYRSVGLDEASIRKIVGDILEGGEAAFRDRARRLRIALAR
jgi:hypothetical protein